MDFSEQALPLTLNDFLLSNKSNHVRKVQQPFEAMLRDAQSKGISVKKAMETEGYKNYIAFSTSDKCPQFPLNCKVHELAEVGVGFVLYFKFLGFLALVLAILLVAQAGPLNAYAKAHGMYTWNFDIRGFTNKEKEACGCSRKNEGMTGMNPAATQNSDYGKYCGTWDLDACLAGLLPVYYGTDGSLMNHSLGMWCCRSWCFADSDCPISRDADSPSRSNVKGDSGIAPGVLTRAYSACSQDSWYVNAYCKAANRGDMVNDVAIAPLDSSSVDNMISDVWLTPGSLGPDLGDDTWILYTYVFCTAVLGVCLVFMAQFIERVSAKIIVHTMDPSDWSVMVSGLPIDATDEADIMNWFKKHAHGGQNGNVEIVKIVICWDPKEWNMKDKQVKHLSKKIRNCAETKEGNALRLLLEDEITRLKDDFKLGSPDAIHKLKGTGNVVITFRYIHDLETCLNVWDNSRSWRKRIYNCCRLVQYGKLPLYPAADGTPAFKITVKQAETAGNINWKELGVPKKERIQRALITNSAMLVTLVLSFTLVYGLTMLGDQLKTEALNEETGEYEDDASTFISFLPAIAISLINVYVVLLASFLGEAEIYETRTAEVSSKTLKMTLVMVVNTAIVLLVWQREPKNWYVDGGLVMDMYCMLSINAATPLLAFVNDSTVFVKWFKRKTLTQAKLDELNKGLLQYHIWRKSRSGERQPYSSIKAYREAREFEKLFEPCDMNSPRHYANALKTFLCSIIYIPLMPMAAAIGMVGLLFQYVVDKYIVLRLRKRPSVVQTSSEARCCMDTVRVVSMIMLPISIPVFLSPSYSEGKDVMKATVAAAVIAAFFVFVPMRILRRLLCARMCVWTKAEGRVGVGTRDYYDAQRVWPAEQKYHKAHFLYKALDQSKNPENLEFGKTRELKRDDMRDIRRKVSRTSQRSRGLVMGRRVVEAEGEADVVGILVPEGDIGEAWRDIRVSTGCRGRGGSSERPVRTRGMRGPDADVVGVIVEIDEAPPPEEPGQAPIVPVLVDDAPAPPPALLLVQQGPPAVTPVLVDAPPRSRPRDPRPVTPVLVDDAPVVPVLCIAPPHYLF
eukprot:NODE_102_length_3658_cov_7.576041.p1 GENE.NODE_102_length_3658_cov_7.576041~~NODE_102_length_3658_cov_7.576041.p1  ORF type:complete len:1075 (-),score=215.76 NODE_102_length_3658_cov_7.576041:139-3363(-)